MALVTQHVYSATHILDSAPPEFLTYKGSTKSTPVLVNGGASRTLNAGRGGGGGTRQGFPSYLWQI